MKERKIRVWDKKQKRMTYDSDFYHIDSHGRVIYIDYDNNNIIYHDKQTEHIKPLFFIGQTDKNGKDIYEGDIVVHCARDFLDSGSCGQSSFLLAGIVEYDEKWAGFVLRTPKHNDHASLYCMTQWPDKYRPFDYNEVLGNIYEDPKMAEKLKELGAVVFLKK